MASSDDQRRTVARSQEISHGEGHERYLWLTKAAAKPLSATGSNGPTTDAEAT